MKTSYAPDQDPQTGTWVYAESGLCNFCGKPLPEGRYMYCEQHTSGKANKGRYQIEWRTRKMHERDKALEQTTEADNFLEPEKDGDWPGGNTLMEIEQNKVALQTDDQGLKGLESGINSMLHALDAGATKFHLKIIVRGVSIEFNLE